MESLENRLQPHSEVTKLLPPATKLGQGNIFRSVCQEFCPQRGWYPSMPCRHPPRQVHLLGQIHPPDRYTPLGRYTPRQVHPPGQVHPQGRYTPQGGTPPRAGTPPRQVPPGRYTPRQVHPPPPWSMSRQYASYWNAFLFSLRTELLASSQSYRSIDVDAWCKRALNAVELFTNTGSSHDKEDTIVRLGFQKKEIILNKNAFQ